MLPNCLFDIIVFCKTFDKSIDNASDHLPVMLKIKFHFNSRTLDHNGAIQNHAIKSKIKWSTFSKEEIDNNYSVPLMTELSTLALDEYNRLANSSDAIINLLKKHANPPAGPICRIKPKIGYILNCFWMSRMPVSKAKSLLTHGSNLISWLRVMSIMFIVANVRSTGISYASFSINLKSIKLLSLVMLPILMNNSFGNSLKANVLLLR